MKLFLPNADQAYIETAKTRDYLLLYHEQDDKSGFFLRFGFRRDQWEVLRDALLRHARDYPVVSIRQTPFGLNYEVEGPLQTPVGREPLVVSIWQIASAEPNPRFITAHPSRRTP